MHTTCFYDVSIIGEDAIKIPGVNPTFWLNHIFFTNPMQFDASVSSNSFTVGVFTIHCICSQTTLDHLFFTAGVALATIATKLDFLVMLYQLSCVYFSLEFIVNFEFVYVDLMNITRIFIHSYMYIKIPYDW